MCKCKNVEIGTYTNQVMLDPPEFMLPLKNCLGEIKPVQKISIDRCISNQVKELWDNGIPTTGCCCGHNANLGYIGIYTEDLEKCNKLGYTTQRKHNILSEVNLKPVDSLYVGLSKGEVCNRGECDGIIEAYEKEGGCSCHSSAPCSYCTTQTEHCPVCGWSADEQQSEPYKGVSSSFGYVYRTDKERYDVLKDGEFGYIHVISGAPSVTRIKGKHNGLTREEIFRKVGCADKYSMAQMKFYSKTEFELTYFSD